jgi:cytochrome P450
MHTVSDNGVPSTSDPGLEDLADFDPFDPAQQGTHHAKMAELRTRCPVARLASGMTVVTRFDDIRTALTERTMQNTHAGRAPGVFVPPEDRLFFFEYDPPDHLPYRRVLLDLLSRRRVANEEPWIRALVEELLDPLVLAGGGEIVSQVSVPLAGRTMMHVAGLPGEDAARWRGWIKDMVLTGFSFNNRNDHGVGYAECYPDQLDYLDEKIAERTEEFEAAGDVAGLPDDTLTRAVAARIDGRPLSHTVKRMMVASVVAGGANTLVNFVSNTFLSLARDSELVGRLHQDGALIPIAVEESLRRDSPSMFMTRTTAEDMELGGAPFCEGQKVLLGLASANRDETVYPQAEEFRLDRADQPPHVAFGWGAHLCLGAHLARLVGITLLDVFLGRVQRVELEPGTAPLPYLSVQGNGLDQLHLRLTPTDRDARQRATS